MSSGQDVPKEKRGVFLVASTANDERFGSVGDHAPRFVPLLSAWTGRRHGRGSANQRIHQQQASLVH
jgi:hypothetical protein